MRLATSFVRATAGAVLLVDCGGGSPKEPTTPVVSAPVLTTVTVALSATTVQIGQSDTARADGFDQRGDPLSVVGAAVWRTSSSAIATVSASGVITGVALGEATITAMVGGKEGEATVVVVPVAVQTVLVSPPGWIAAPGETLQLTATTQDVEDNVLTGRIVTWSSTDAAVATVSATGLVAARLPGTAIIVATSEGQSGAAVIDVAGELPGGVVVSIATPATDAVVGDTLNVVASASSSARISGAVASVGSQTLPLTRVLVGASGVIEAWVGRMILNGSYGTFELLVSATDAHDALGVDSVSFTRQKKVLGGNSTTPGRKALRPSAPKIP